MDCMSCNMNVLPTKEEIVAQIMESMGIKCPNIVRNGFVQRDLLENFCPTAVKCAVFCGEQIGFVLSILEFAKTNMPQEFPSALKMGVMMYAEDGNQIEFLQEIFFRYPETDLHFDGEAPLRHACSTGNLHYVKFLLNNGANPLIRNAGVYNQNAFEYAKGFPQILELLNRHLQLQNL